MADTRFLVNPAVRRGDDYAGLFAAEDYRAVESFYDARPWLPASPLHSLPGLAAELGIGGLLVKDESRRFGLEAFKAVGVAFAIDRIDRNAVSRGVVCATAGNHGRAVARAARDAQIPCTVFVPSLTADALSIERTVRSARVSGMRLDGADVIEVEGTYEEAVGRAASHARERGGVMLSDTASVEDDAIARSIMLGYTHLFSEVSRQRSARPDVVIVQGGVGGLVAAAASWFAFHDRSGRPMLIACEPDAANCLLESAQAGKAVDLDAGNRPRLRTVMAGLRCATPSAAAWPAVRDGIDAFVSIPDALALEALERLGHPTAADPAIVAGPSGACGIGALLGVVRQQSPSALGELVRLDQSTSVMAIVTEGA